MPSDGDAVRALIVGNGKMRGLGPQLELVSRLGANGDAVRILHGATVKPGDAQAILALPQVGGALAGGASLEAIEFEAIVRAVP